MKAYDWIVVGAGITGAALSYELVKQGFSVLLLEQSAAPRNATRFSYGGIAYWSGTTDLTRQLCAEGAALYYTLSDELDADIQFRELDLVLTIATTADPEQIAASYAHFATPPRLLNVQEACDLEPLLNPQAIAGALTVKHGHIDAQATADAYIQAFTRLGGTLQIGQVTALQRGDGLRVVGVTCGQEAYAGENVVICAGALSRSLLKAAGIPIRVYFTHAELIETPSVDVTLRSLVMPADNQRFQLEATASTAELDPLWDVPGNEPAAAILDVGAIQFLDGRIRIGQISRTLSDPDAEVDAAASEADMREGIGTVLPALGTLPGTWHRCLIAFSSDKLPLIGPVPTVEGVHVFSGFSNPLAIVPPLARRFAASAKGHEDGLIERLAPARFGGG